MHYIRCRFFFIIVLCLWHTPTHARDFLAPRTVAEHIAYATKLQNYLVHIEAEYPGINEHERPVSTSAADATATKLHGSGFFIKRYSRRRGCRVLAVTNAHVIKPKEATTTAGRIRVLLSGTLDASSAHTAHVLAYSTEEDLAVLHVPSMSCTLARAPVLSKETDPLSGGERVWQTYAPHGSPKMQYFVLGMLNSIHRARDTDHPVHFGTSVPVAPGQSGGPVFLDGGADEPILIGIVKGWWKHEPEQNIIISVHRLHVFLRDRAI